MMENKKFDDWELPNPNYVASVWKRRALKDPDTGEWIYYFEIYFLNGHKGGGFGTGTTHIWFVNKGIEVFEQEEIKV